MAINEYMSPKQDQFNQTYVSQYVPLPFEDIQNNLKAKQKQYDETENVIDSLRNLNVQARPGKDTEERNMILSDYDNKLNSILESSGGDLTKVQKDVYGLAREINKDMSRGVLGELDTRAKQREEWIKQGGDYTKRGDLLESVIAKVDKEYDEMGARQGGADNYIRSWSTDVTDLSKRANEYAGVIKEQIRKYVGRPNQAVDSEGNPIPGYLVTIDNEKVTLTPKEIKTVLKNSFEGDLELQNSLDQADYAGKQDREALESAMKGAGIAFERNDIKDSSKFLDDNLYDKETGTYKSPSPLIKSLGTFNDNSINKSQEEFKIGTESAYNNIAKLVNAPELKNNPRLLDQIKTDDDFALYLETHLDKNDSDYDSKYDAAMKEWREAEVNKSLMKYYYDDYYQSPEGKNARDNFKKALLMQNINEETINKLIMNADALGALASAFTIDNINEAREYLEVGGFFSKKNTEFLDKFFKKDIFNNPKVREAITQIRKKTDAYAETKETKKSAYQPVIFGHPEASNKSVKNFVDNQVEYVTEYFQDRLDQLDITNEDGTKSKAKSVIDTQIKALQGDEENPNKVKTIIEPTSETGSKGMYRLTVKNDKGETGTPIYVYESNFDQGSSIYSTIKNRLRAHVSRNPNDDAAVEMLDDLYASEIFKGIDENIVTNTLKGGTYDPKEANNIETGEWYIPNPKNIQAQIKVKFKLIKGNDGKNLGVGLYNDKGKLIIETDAQKGQIFDLKRQLWKLTKEYNNMNY